MRFEFTPAAQRALAAAAGWISCEDAAGLGVPEVLLGLLAEPECRAALLLAQVGVDADAVRRRFANLTAAEALDLRRATRYSNEWAECLRVAESLLVDYPRPLELATEHLLLGIAATPGEVSRWLAERGLEATVLEAEVHRLAGHQIGPLPLDGDEVGLAEDDEFEIPPHDQLAALRVIDAAANRASEGLRVIEDYLRFALDDRHLTAECKAVRHELTAALAAFPSAMRHAARDTRADVGTDLTLASERRRGDLASVVAANFDRASQALRSLEEFSKPLAVKSAAQLEKLRYRVYTLERAVDITRTSLERLAHARLYVLIDACPSADEFRSLGESLIGAGVGVIQLRDKTLADRELVARGRLLAELVRESQTLFIMNDRPDLAVLCGADGVHVGQQELSVKDARRIVGPRALIGVSTHSLDQARTAVLDGANYIGVGPTFPSTTKQFAEFTGLDLLRCVQAEIRLPAFAIGGITLDNLPQVLATGFSRAAVSGAITEADDPGSAARQMHAALGGGGGA